MNISDYSLNIKTATMFNLRVNFKFLFYNKEKPMFLCVKKNNQQ